MMKIPESTFSLIKLDLMMVLVFREQIVLTTCYENDDFLLCDENGGNNQHNNNIKCNKINGYKRYKSK